MVRVIQIWTLSDAHEIYIEKLEFFEMNEINIGRSFIGTDRTMYLIYQTLSCKAFLTIFPNNRKTSL